MLNSTTSDQNSGSIVSEIPGYYWGTEQAAPQDGDTANRVTVEVTYGVDVQEDAGEWRWSGINLPDREGAESHAENYTGTHTPVPVPRRVIEVTRTSYTWDGESVPTTRVAVAETHRVVSEHTYP